MKSQGDGAIHFVNLSNLLTRLRRKSPLAEGEGGERGGGREREKGREGEETFIGSSIWQNFFNIFCFPCIYFKTYLLCIASYIDFPL